MKPLTDLSTFDADGHVNVIIETPKGSRNKYAYDPEVGTFRFKAVLPEGSLFPFDFGFIPLHSWRGWRSPRHPRPAGCADRNGMPAHCAPPRGDRS
ncbi:inorganic diphosphatase [Methylorubrum extorquens]